MRYPISWVSLVTRAPPKSSDSRRSPSLLPIRPEDLRRTPGGLPEDSRRTPGQTATPLTFTTIYYTLTTSRLLPGVLPGLLPGVLPGRLPGLLLATSRPPPWPPPDLPRPPPWSPPGLPDLPPRTPPGLLQTSSGRPRPPGFSGVLPGASGTLSPGSAEVAKPL